MHSPIRERQSAVEGGIPVQTNRPADLPTPRDNGPLDLDSFSRIVRRSQERARELVARIGGGTSPDEIAPLAAATDEWLAAVEELEVAEEELRAQSDELAASAAAAEAHQARYQELFELAPDAYLVTDGLGSVHEANHAASQLLRIPRNYLNGKPIAVFVDQDGRRALRNAIDRLRGDEQVDQFEMRLRPRYGPGVVVAATAAASRDGQGEVTTIRWILRDVTEQRRVAERAQAISINVERRVGERTARLEQMMMGRDARVSVIESELAAERAARARAEEIAARRADLLGMLSHEIRTPLHASQGYLELLELTGTSSLSREQLGYLKRMQQCQAYLVTVLEGVLSLSRFERGTSELDLATVSVDAVLSTIPALVEPQMIDKGIRFEWDNGDTSVTVRADPEKLQQILLNLVTNAIKFTPRGGLVAVGWEATGDAVLVRVRDTGSGIRATDIERIFEPFVQGTNVSGSMHSGVGLGLAISRQLTRLMGGDLTVVSTVGEGATFTLRLPRTADGDA